jgi:hypothetical protein
MGGGLKKSLHVFGVVSQQVMVSKFFSLGATLEKNNNYK